MRSEGESEGGDGNQNEDDNEHYDWTFELIFHRSVAFIACISQLHYGQCSHEFEAWRGEQSVRSELKR